MNTLDQRTPRRDPAAPAALVGDVTDAGTVELNATAYAVWQLCDGETTVSEMVDAAIELFDAPDDVIAADVERLLHELRSLGLVVWD